MEETFETLWEIVVTILEAFFKGLWWVIRLIVWILFGIIILPCVFIAGNLYPLWVKWGDEAF